MQDTALLDDCWNRIGVRGDRSCVRLESVQHCRHCPVHAEAAHRIMQRHAPASMADEWADIHARPLAPERSGSVSKMVFRIGREWLCLRTGMCLQVADPAPVHVLPHRSNALLTGVVNIDGRLTPQLSLGALLGIDPLQTETAVGRYVYPRLMLLQAGDHVVAVPVTELHGIARTYPEDKQPLPATVGKGAAPFLSGVITVGALQVGMLNGDLVAGTLSQALK